MRYEDVLDRVNAIHKHTKVTVYTHGDVEKEDSLRLYDEIVNSIQSSQKAAIERVGLAEDKTSLCVLAVSPTADAVGLDPALLVKDMTELIDKPHYNAPTTTSTGSEVAHKPDVSGMLTPEYEWKSRSRLLTEPHTRVLLPAFNPNDANSALVTYFQVSFLYKTLLNLTNQVNTPSFSQAEVRSAKVAAIILIISRLLSEPVFTSLRTKEQLGYIVSLTSTAYGRYPGIIRGFAVRVLSKRFDPIYMEVR